ALDKVVGLADKLPGWFGDFREHAAHAWCIASFLKYEFGKVYVDWEIEKVEYAYRDSRFDVVAIKPDGEKAILEFKTIREGTEAGELIKRAAKYVRVCTDNTEFEEIQFIFQVDQNNEIPQEGVKQLYRALKEFQTTGNLKLPDGTIVLSISPDEASRILKILTWTGGYLP
ncbi:MAG: hypothetical protein ACPL4E_07280, partial [Thermoproteota archaeon]